MDSFKGDGIYREHVDGIPLEVQYGYNEITGADKKVRKYPKIIRIMLDSPSSRWDLTYITDHNIQEQLENNIFREINKEIYG
jgi:hypothetical protein